MEEHPSEAATDDAALAAIGAERARGAPRPGREPPRAAGQRGGGRRGVPARFGGAAARDGTPAAGLPVGAPPALMAAALGFAGLAGVRRAGLGRVGAVVAPHRMERAAAAVSCLLMALFLVGVRA